MSTTQSHMPANHFGIYDRLADKNYLSGTWFNNALRNKLWSNLTLPTDNKRLQGMNEGHDYLPCCCFAESVKASQGSPFHSVAATYYTVV